MNKVIEGDSLIELKKLADNSVNCCVTSPPYWGLRDYNLPPTVWPDWVGCLGLEPTPEMYVGHIVLIFKEVFRVLRKDGTLWLNLGDSYAGSGKGRLSDGTHSIGGKQNTNVGSISGKIPKLDTSNLKPKDLVGIPWMVAFALRADGWYLRMDIIWHKKNPMPESVKDRPTKSHEYIFLMSKSKKYYYDQDAIKTPLADSSISRLSQNIEGQTGSNRVPNKTNGPMKAVGNLRKGRKPRAGIDTKGGNQAKGDIPMGINGSKFKGHSGNYDSEGNLISGGMANKKSVWIVASEPFKEAHYATFPQELIIDCIKAGCPEDGIVLDPFFGSGTTGLVANKLYRKYIGIELGKQNIEIANNRLYKDLGMFM